MPPTQTEQRLIPVTGCWVCKWDDEQRLGSVIRSVGQNGHLKVEVDWSGGVHEILNVEELKSGFQRGFIVHDVPTSTIRQSLGPGVVLEKRRLAECDQVLIQLHSDGRLVWLPYENLRRIMGPELQHRRGEMLSDDAGERVAINLMAHALRTWNDSTGALDRLDVDPLPHQIQLVHKILASGHCDWLIADDVGLGKTVEVGLLLAALERRQRLRRVLIITPASLTRQWQDEMQTKFDQSYEIYGHDFFVDAPWKWKLRDKVISSLDLLKPRDASDDGTGSGSHYSKLMWADPWDLVIFDEAHRLSRTEDGTQTLRYRLARALRERGQGLLLLTGTPHQGDTGRFKNLLQLVRPSLSPQIAELELSPDIVSEIILRNRKIDVTDASGNFVFQGQTVKRVQIPSTEATTILEKELNDYFRRGFGAGEKQGGARGRAIGFVMTTYRKLASSSVAALRAALGRRLSKLRSSNSIAPGDRYVSLQDLSDDADDLDRIALTDTAIAFFDAEAELLGQLISLADGVLENDLKMLELKKAVSDLTKSDRKAVIFTEYRATQDYIVSELSKQVDGPIATINGSQKLTEKIRNVRSFDDESNIIVCTEAGGEGLNLHRNCHVLINYDIPWNPTRIVQRIGRIYRYGQTEKVVILNFQAVDTIDNQVIDYALSRVMTIAREMAPVGEEFKERYEAEIIGELLEQLDIAEILEGALTTGVERSKERIDEAILRARNAQEMQDDILSHTARFDPEALRRLGGFSTQHLSEFICRAAKLVDVAIERNVGDSERFILRLPDQLRGRFVEFGASMKIECTTRRSSWNLQSTITLLDFSTSFVRFLIEKATASDAHGAYATINRADLGCDIIAGFSSRWQTEQGEMIGEELLVAIRSNDGGISIDNQIVQGLFMGGAPTGHVEKLSPEERRHRFDALRDRVEVHMAANKSEFRHPNGVFCLAVADICQNDTLTDTHELEQSGEKS